MLVVTLVAFLATAALAAIDILSDLGEGATGGHVLIETGILAAGLVGAGFAARRLVSTLGRARVAVQEAQLLAGQLEATSEEAARWRKQASDLIAGLGAAIDRQFERWKLSPAEKEVGLLLLKGLSHREVADVRSVSEDTARQQARALYRKAGLSGHHDLAAFFLEDLMLPVDVADPRLAKT